MTFDELVQEVYTLTNRPDRVGETQVAIRAATLRSHHLDFFYKDIQEQYLTFATSDYYQQIALTSIFNFRALSYMRKYYPGVVGDQTYQAGQVPPLQNIGYYPGNNLPDGREIKIITPTNVLDSYGMNKVDVAYIAGSTIQIKSGDQIQNILFGYYQNPDVTMQGYNSWIAREHPYAIVYDAASTIFKTIGYDEQVTFYNALVQQEQNQVILSNIQAEGY